VGQKLGPLAHQKGASPQQVAGLAQGAGIDVSLGKKTAAQQRGDLCSVNLVVLGFTAVNRLHVERVPEHEGNALVLTKVGKPVPGKHALDAHHESVSKGFNGVQESVGVSLQILLEARFALLVEDVQKQSSGVQVAAGVKSMGVVVETH